MSFNFTASKYSESHARSVRAVWRGGAQWISRLRADSTFGPEWNQVVYQNRDGLFSSEEGWEFVLKRIFPGSVMAMDGADHLYQRRIMSSI